MAFSIAGGIIIAGLVIFGFFIGLGLYAEGGAPGAIPAGRGAVARSWWSSPSLRCF
jgi:hypothetical protein